jgi:hypothetical protein
MDEDFLMDPEGNLGIVEATGTADSAHPSGAVGAREPGENYGTGNPSATLDVMPPPGDLGRISDEDADRLEPGDDPLTARDAEAEIASSTSAGIGGVEPPA